MISYGKDRTEAIAVMLRALRDFKIFGVKTGIPFLIQVLQEPKFIEGSYDTGFLENEFDFSKLERRDEEVYKTISAIALHLFKTKEKKAEISFAKNHEKHKSRWKLRLQSYRKWH